MRHYDFIRHWTKRIVPHLGDELLNRVLVRDFNKFTMYCGNGGRFSPGQYPCEFDKDAWRLCHRGRKPRYCRYVKYGACHWLCNFNLRLATLAEPARPWRVLVSFDHSTVWDGRDTIFDPSHRALGVPAQVSFDLAYLEELPVGKFRRVYTAKGWRTRE